MSNRILAVTGWLLLLLLRSAGALWGRRRMRTKMSSTVAFWSFQLLGRMFHINWWTRGERLLCGRFAQKSSFFSFCRSGKERWNPILYKNSTLSHTFCKTALMRVTPVVHSCIFSLMHVVVVAFFLHHHYNKRSLLSIILWHVINWMM